MYKSLSSRCPRKFANYKPVILFFSESAYVCLSPLTSVYKPNPFSSTAFRSDTATIRYSDRREIDMSPWIYGGITGDFETPRNLTVGKKGKKRIPQPPQEHQKS
jgi:hypothetical protein